jgi:hypothetical protein
VEPAPGVLQPIEIPTSIEPFSVYPIVRCASEIGKVSEPEVNNFLTIGHVYIKMHIVIKSKKSCLLHNQQSGYMLLTS